MPTLLQQLLLGGDSTAATGRTQPGRGRVTAVTGRPQYGAANIVVPVTPLPEDPPILASVGFNGVPVEWYGWTCRAISGWTDFPAITFNAVKVAGVPGDVLVDTPAQIAPRINRVTLQHTAVVTQLERREALAALAFALAGLVEYSSVEDSNRISYCHVTEGRNEGVTPLSLANQGYILDLTLTAADPYYYQRVPTTVTLPPNKRVILPLGTAAVRGIITVNGGGTGSGAVGIRLRHQSGQVLGEMILTGLTVAAGDTIEFDCQNYEVWHYRDATDDWVSVLDYLADGNDFMSLDPLDAPTLEILNGYDGFATYRIGDLV